MAQYVTIRVLDVKSKDNTHFKLRLDQKLGVMFREYSRRRDNLAYSFLLDGDVIDAEHTARLLVLRDQDVIVAEEKPGRVLYGSLCGNQILAPHAIETTLSRSPRLLDGVEVHEGPRIILTHWLISTQSPTAKGQRRSRPRCGAA